MSILTERKLPHGTPNQSEESRSMELDPRLVRYYDTAGCAARSLAEYQADLISPDERDAELETWVRTFTRMANANLGNFPNRLLTRIAELREDLDWAREQATPAEVDGRRKRLDELEAMIRATVPDAIEALAQRGDELS